MHSKFSTSWMLCNAYDDMSNFNDRSKHQRCYRGALPLVDLRAGCFVRAICSKLLFYYPRENKVKLSFLSKGDDQLIRGGTMPWMICNNMMHARSVRSHKLRKITIASGIDGGIQWSLINVANTYYTIALLCTCKRSTSAQTLTVWQICMKAVK